MQSCGFNGIASLNNHSMFLGLGSSAARSGDFWDLLGKSSQSSPHNYVTFQEVC